MNLWLILEYSFVQRAIITGVFVAILCSSLGLFLVLRRLSLIGDGLSHVAFGSIAVGIFLGIYPLYVAIPLVVLGSIFILKLTKKAKIYGDAAIGIVSSVALSAGIILANVAGGFNVDLLSYLFGNILAVSKAEMLVSIGLSLLVVTMVYFYYYELLSVSFNEDLAHITGIKTERVTTLLIVLTAITVVLSVRIVGILLISSLLIFPSITALQISHSFRGTIFMSIFIAIVSLIVGILVSFIFDLPTGAVIVMANFVLFVFVSLLARRAK
jgi:zinc transport system permease protein